MAQVRIHTDAIAGLATAPVVQAHLELVSDYIAETAARFASFRESHGQVLHSERQDDGTWRVGWDAAHFFYRFHELGSGHEPARPFLRPAADSVR